MRAPAVQNTGIKEGKRQVTTPHIAMTDGELIVISYANSSSKICWSYGSKSPLIFANPNQPLYVPAICCLHTDLDDRSMVDVLHALSFNCCSLNHTVLDEITIQQQPRKSYTIDWPRSSCTAVSSATKLVLENQKSTFVEEENTWGFIKYLAFTC